MRHDWKESVEFVASGTRLVTALVEGLDEAELSAPTTLPGWQRRHLVAHLAANAEAIGRLVSWAKTSIPTPMYANPEQRNRDIERGARRSAGELVSWLHTASTSLAAEFAEMTPAARHQIVRTAQGRNVPASETAWMRAREVLIHAVDLDCGVSFADLPEAFLVQLRDEILSKRADEEVPALEGDVPQVVAYLSGRPFTGVARVDAEPLQTLRPWL
ncbi:MAG: maleylpyruvate isomerase N-terminal domain-containing protein [Nostocoides sp.]